MHLSKILSRALIRRNFPLLVTALAIVCLTSAIGRAEAHNTLSGVVEGVVEGNGVPQAGYKVFLYASKVKGKPFQRLLGTDTTDGLGLFEIKAPRGLLRRQ